LGLQKLETKADVKMSIEGLEKLIFTNVHFSMNVKLEKDEDQERKKAESLPDGTENLPAATVMGRKRPDKLRADFQVTILDRD